MKQATTYKYIKLLEKNNNISLNCNNKFSLVTVVNWELYQLQDENCSNNVATTWQQRSNNVAQTRKIKKDNKVKNITDRKYDENFLNGIYANGG